MSSINRTDETSPLGVNIDERTAIFIDGPNLYSAAKSANLDLDYQRLLEHLKEDSRFLRAYYYTTVVVNDDPDAYSPVKPLIDWLDYNGYYVVTKPMKEFVDEQLGTRRQKGNMSVEIAVDMLSLTLADKVDHVILFSGDGDFSRLVEAVQAKGVRVTVVSSLRHGQSAISDELRRQADAFVDLFDLKNVLVRDVAVREARRATGAKS